MIMWLCGLFLVWLCLGMIMKTRTPIRDLARRFGILKPKPLPEPEHERFDLEVD